MATLRTKFMAPVVVAAVLSGCSTGQAPSPQAHASHNSVPTTTAASSPSPTPITQAIIDGTLSPMTASCGQLQEVIVQETVRGGKKYYSGDFSNPSDSAENAPGNAVACIPGTFQEAYANNLFHIYEMKGCLRAN